MGVKSWCSALAMGFVLYPITGSVTASMGYAQSIAVREESAASTRHTLITVSARQAPLARILRDIAAQANLSVAIPAKVSQSPARVTVDVNAMPLEQVLAKVLDGTGFKATVASGGIGLYEEVKAASTVVPQGSVMGKVIDGKTRQGLRGATITVSGTNKGTTSGDDGAFHIVAIAPGSYTIHVRMLGYVKTAKTVTVVDEQTTSVDVILEPSVNALDQVIVTGTVVATARKEVPNAMTVITAKDIEQRGITQIQQLFRGDVPGLFAMNLGSRSPIDSVTMFARGVTKVNDSGNLPIKTYVDGVELANSSYLSQIDPASIERIEILAGPQASTVYGSNAINGVMQIFTKRGTTAKPQLAATLVNGLVENDFRPTYTPRHDYTAQISGTEGRWSYNMGGSWNYMGAWTPSKQTDRLSGFGGARLHIGPISADGSLRLGLTQNHTSGGDQSQWLVSLQESGISMPTAAARRSSPATSHLRGQTLGLTLGYTPASWWSHEFVVGQDASDSDRLVNTIGYTSPSDTLLTLSQSQMTRTSVRYATTARISVTPMASAVLIAGVDGWQRLSSTLSASPTSLTGTLNGTTRVSRLTGHNTGAFLQGQVGIQDALFVTYGLRAEWNPNYGDEVQPNFAPRYGVAYTQDVGVVTAKLRASYGRSTRPPTEGQKSSKLNSDEVLLGRYGIFDAQVNAPELGPEFQQGGEGGVEVYFGGHGSIILTRYNQTVDALITTVRGIDSVYSLIPFDASPGSNYCGSRDELGHCYYYQTRYVNAGSLRNQGWEMQGSFNTGPLTTGITYTFSKSRMIGAYPQYRSFLSWETGSGFNNAPEHTWAFNLAYLSAQTMVALNVTGTGMIYTGGNELYNLYANANLRLRNQLSNWRSPCNGGACPQRGYLITNLNMSRRFSPHLEGLVQVQNLTNHYQNDSNWLYAVLGRQTQLGFRLRR